MAGFQRWLEQTLRSADGVAAIMQTQWAWPIAESVHFIGLTLLFGSIAAWDLRLLGVARRVPIAAFHRLVPLSVLGFSLNAVTGSLFLMTFPDQYIYNPAFHLKVLFLGLAGANVLVFYATTYRRVNTAGADSSIPVGARVAGVTSLICWTAIIIFGRLLTFYRPNSCQPGEAIAFLSKCFPN
jgi:hypothetical protein